SSRFSELKDVRFLLLFQAKARKNWMILSVEFAFEPPIFHHGLHFPRPAIPRRLPVPITPTGVALRKVAGPDVIRGALLRALDQKRAELIAFLPVFLGGLDDLGGRTQANIPAFQKPTDCPIANSGRLGLKLSQDFVT